MVGHRLTGHVALSALALTLSAALTASANPRDREHRLTTADGRGRRYVVHRPPGDRGERSDLPAVLVLHGGGGNADGFARTTDMNRVADLHGFLAVYPEGIGKKLLGKYLATWNAGTCCRLARDEEVDDVAFLGAVIDDLVGRYRIDPERVFATGISNGAMMSQRLACELSGRIAGVAAVAGPGFSLACEPERPVPMLLIHGTDDRCALFDGGGDCGGGFQRAIASWLGTRDRGKGRFPCVSVATQTDQWAEHNGCSEGEERYMVRGSVECGRRLACAGAPVEVCVVNGGGHTWPGTRERCDPSKKLCQSYTAVTGEVNMDIDASTLVWDFFDRVSSEPAAGCIRAPLRPGN